MSQRDTLVHLFAGGWVRSSLYFQTWHVLGCFVNTRLRRAAERLVLPVSQTFVFFPLRRACNSYKPGSCTSFTCLPKITLGTSCQRFKIYRSVNKWKKIPHDLYRASKEPIPPEIPECATLKWMFCVFISRILRFRLGGNSDVFPVWMFFFLNKLTQF